MQPTFLFCTFLIFFSPLLTTLCTWKLLNFSMIYNYRHCFLLFYLNWRESMYHPSPNSQLKMLAPFLASMPSYLQCQPCMFPHNYRHRRHSRRGILVTLTPYLSMPSMLSIGGSLRSGSYDLWHSSGYSHRWLQAAVLDAGYPLTCCCPMRDYRWGCLQGNVCSVMFPSVSDN